MRKCSLPLTGNPGPVASGTTCAKPAAQTVKRNAKTGKSRFHRCALRNNNRVAGVSERDRSALSPFNASL